MQHPNNGQQMEYAGVGVRVLATIIDTVILFAALVAMIGLAAAFDALELPAPGTTNPFAADLSIPTWIYLATYGLLFAYYAVFEAMMAATPGKLALGMKVMMDDGNAATGTAIVVRNIIRIAEAFLWYVPSAISCLLSSTNKRLGDYAAGTVVVRRALVPAAAGPASPVVGSARPEPAPAAAASEAQTELAPAPAAKRGQPSLTRVLDKLKTAVLAVRGAHEVYLHFSEMELATASAEPGEPEADYSPEYVAAWYSLADAVNDMKETHATASAATQRKGIPLDVFIARQPDLVYLLRELDPYLAAEAAEDLHDAYMRVVRGQSAQAD